jgi:hypothetical protein
VDRRALLSLFRLAVVVVLISGIAFSTAQFLPSIPASQQAAQVSGDDDFGTAVERMTKGRQEAADRYARASYAAERRIDRIQATWGRAVSTVRAMTWLERITFVLTVLFTVSALRMLPIAAKLARRRLLDSSFGPE